MSLLDDIKDLRDSVLESSGSLADDVADNSRGLVEDIARDVRDDTIMDLPGQGDFWYYIPRTEFEDGSVTETEWGVTYSGLMWVAVLLGAGLAFTTFSKK